MHGGRRMYSDSEATDEALETDTDDEADDLGDGSRKKGASRVDPEPVP